MYQKIVFFHWKINNNSKTVVIIYFYTKKLAKVKEQKEKGKQNILKYSLGRRIFILVRIVKIAALHDLLPNSELTKSAPPSMHKLLRWNRQDIWTLDHNIGRIRACKLLLPFLFCLIQNFSLGKIHLSDLARNTPVILKTIHNSLIIWTKVSKW